MSFTEEADDLLLARGAVETGAAAAAGSIDLVQRLDLAQSTGNDAIIEVRTIQLAHKGHDERVAQMLTGYEQLSMVTRPCTLNQCQQLTQFGLH
ncbi:hypothetical protein PPL19_12668 [Pseudomonas psychrotolerans L19]|nr:hypothetical protein PPL19_12668 [Pseudomonas psychrotolerans L19]